MNTGVWLSTVALIVALLHASTSNAEEPHPTDAEILRAKLAALHRRWEALGGVSCVESVSTVSWSMYYLKPKGSYDGPLPVWLRGRMERYLRCQEHLYFNGYLSSRPEVYGPTAKIKPTPLRHRTDARYEYFDQDQTEPTLFSSLSAHFFPITETFGYRTGWAPGDFPADWYAEVARLDAAGNSWSVRFKESKTPEIAIFRCGQIDFDPVTGMIGRVRLWNDEGWMISDCQIVCAWHTEANEYLPVAAQQATYAWTFDEQSGRSAGEPFRMSFFDYRDWSTHHNDAPEAYGWPAMGIDPARAENIPVDYYTGTEKVPTPYLLDRGKLFRRRKPLPEVYRGLLHEAQKNPAVLFTSPWAIALWGGALALVASAIWIFSRRGGTPRPRA